MLRIIACMLLVGLPGCSDNAEEWLRLNGSTMGTVYHITARCSAGTVLQSAVDRELEWVNSLMSTYISDSSLSRFNAAAIDTWIPVEQELLDVVDAAIDLSRTTEGAYDITVGPLVNLWGFGAPGNRSGKQPEATEIRKALQRVGYSMLETRMQPSMLRKHGNVYVDLSSIAKGYGVDRIAELLTKKECANYLVDIGGEVRTLGFSPRSRSWRIGLEVPEAESFGAINRIIELPDVAVATSGDYRNFVEWDGITYSHIIDPRTGYPVSHSLASVTVIHSSTMQADAIATLLTVLGPDAGWQYAQKHNLAVLFVWRSETGFEQRHTPSFSVYLVE